MLLKWEDRSSMANSIEARVPFLDYRIFEYSQELTDSQKISSGTTKKILRESQKNIVPDEILNRKDKIGFATDEKKWFSQNKKEILSLIKKYMHKELINYDYVEKNYKYLNDNHTLWRILNLLVW